MESLPLGFRFRPTDFELINHYLRLKIEGRHSEVQVIPEVDVCKWEPWDLPRLSVIKTEDPEWFFFCPRDRKYPNGHRSNRATDAGYWKATGKDRTIKSIKSSPSGHSKPQLIGMKKTLVFYRGRAPKGERTHWIMHEYRATEPDLDGTTSDQGAYVLCRLFRKPEEKTDNCKYDEDEPTSFSPATVKSSPDDTSSDLFQEQSLPDMEVGKQPEVIKRWLTDKSDEMTPNSYLHVESCMPEADDQSTGAAAAAAEVFPLRGGVSIRQDFIDDHDWKAFSPVHAHRNTDIARVDSPFADDFGSNHNGLHFQDGTSEQDVSLTDLLDDLRNHASPCEESRSKKFLDTGSQSLPSGNNDCLDQGLAKSENLPFIGLFTDMNSNTFQEQVQKSRSLHAQGSDHDPDSSMSNLRATYDQYGRKYDSLPHSVMHSLCNPEQSFDHTKAAGHGSSHVEVETGIRIRKRQPRNQASPENLSTQGTAARRIHLQMDYAQECSDASSFSNAKKEESIISEGSEVSDTQSNRDEREVGQEKEGKAGCGLRNTKQDGNTSGARTSSMFWRRLMPGFGGIKLARVYAVSLYILVVLSVIFVGISKCPSFHALH